jgi:hypothetical protein
MSDRRAAGIRGHVGIAFAPRGVPARVPPGKSARIRLRTVDELGKVVAGVSVALTGGGLDLHATSDARGYATVAFTAPKARTRLLLKLTTSAPHAAYRATIEVSTKKP